MDKQHHPMTALERQVHEDMRWARANGELEQQYQGQVIAVRHRQVIAQGTSEDELLQRLASAGCSREEVAIVEYPSFFESPR